MSSAEATEQSSDAHQPMGLVEFVVFASSAMAVPLSQPVAGLGPEALPPRYEE